MAESVLMKKGLENLFSPEKKFEDDIPLEVKKRRLREITDLQQIHGLYRMKRSVGRVFRVLIEGVSKKNENEFKGRNSESTVIVFPKKDFKVGQYANVLVNDCTSATLIGEAVAVDYKGEVIV